eukprot:scpid56131/ scgid1741/ 
MAEESDDYEEVLVYAEFSGLVETGESFWSNAPNHVGLLGLDTDEPLLQIGEVTFRGSFEDSVGSLMFFDGQSQDSSSALGLASSVPPLLTPAAANAVASAAADRTAYRYACHTDKVLHMKRIFLQAKGDLEADGLLPTTSGPAKEAQVDGLLPTAGEHRNAADKNAEMVSTDVDAAAAAAEEPTADVAGAANVTMMDEETTGAAKAVLMEDEPTDAVIGAGKAVMMDVTSESTQSNIALSTEEGTQDDCGMQLQPAEAASNTDTVAMSDDIAHPLPP